MFSIFFSFYRNKVQVKKNIEFSKICEKRFLSEKNPTSSVKIRGFGGQKMFFKFAEILLIISSEKEKFLVLAVFRKTFSIGKKSNFNFQNRGYFLEKNNPPKKFLWFFYFFYRNKPQVKKKYPIFENFSKKFSIGKKSDFKFQNRGYFVKKKYAANLLELWS